MGGQSVGEATCGSTDINSHLMHSKQEIKDQGEVCHDRSGQGEKFWWRVVGLQSLSKVLQDIIAGVAQICHQEEKHIGGGRVHMEMELLDIHDPLPEILDRERGWVTKI
jgi:hypothetical protein